MYSSTNFLYILQNGNFLYLLEIFYCKIMSKAPPYINSNGFEITYFLLNAHKISGSVYSIKFSLLKYSLYSFKN